MAETGSMQHTYKMFNTKSFRESLSIPDAIWNELEPLVKAKITEIRAKIRETKKAQMEITKPEKLPNQYPSIKSKETMLNMVSSMAELSMIDDDADTDDDMVTSSVYMARTSIVMDPPGELRGEPDDTIEVKAHFEYSL